MTSMRRVTITFPDDVDAAILSLRTKKEFARCSYSEIVRRLVNAALDKDAAEADKRDSA